MRSAVITRSQEPGHPNTDYNFAVPVEKLVEVRRIFAEKYGVPSRTIAWGSSRGDLSPVFVWK
jgi:hypothetical protein